MTWLCLKVKGYLAAIGVALAVIAGAFLYGRSDGRADAERVAEKANAAAREQSKEVENEINALGDDGVDARLARWMRNSKR